jgi:mannonate dehydratase
MAPSWSPFDGGASPRELHLRSPDCCTFVGFARRRLPVPDENAEGLREGLMTMQMTFRWYGAHDRVTLGDIKQIPGVRGIVSALNDVAVGEVWPKARLDALAGEIDAAGFSLSVVESIPIHEDIKLGRSTRDRFIDHYAESVRNMGDIGVPVLCYNFMPIFDWTRTELAAVLPDGSATLAYDDDALARIDLSRGTGELPGWATTYDGPTLRALRDAYREVPEEQLWENLAYFLERVVPVAESAGVKLAIHPDDPPWSIFGLPRIVTSGEAFDRLTRLVDSPANGVTFCTGSLAADPANDLPAIARELGARGRIHFAHCRNVKVTGHRKFSEVPHPSAYGNVDMHAVLSALHETGFGGPMRSDHGRMIWGESGRPGYGLYDRALGATYLHGLWEGITRTRKS